MGRRRPQRTPAERIFSLLVVLGTIFFTLAPLLVKTIIGIGDSAIRISSLIIYLVVEMFRTGQWLRQVILKSIRLGLKRANFFLVTKKRQWSTLKKKIPTLPLKKFRKRISVLTKIPRPERPKATRPVFLLPKWLLLLTLAVFLGLGLGSVYTYNLIKSLPDPVLLANREIPLTTRIYDRNGVLLYQFYAQENRLLVKLEDLPKSLIDATIAVEDKNFYRHHGLDIKGIARAVFANASGQPIQGGSTITQQLVKSALLTPERSWERKIKEIIISLWAEKVYSKEEILEMYLNQVPYGSTAYGVQAAANYYFAKEASDLTLAESALLAGLPSAPSIYSPFGPNPKRAKERQELVLATMVDQGLIAAQEAENASHVSLDLKPRPGEIKAPHFVMFVKDYLAEKYGTRAVDSGGLEVHTTLDHKTYELVLGEIGQGVAKQTPLRVGNGAALVVDPRKGEILAMVGSQDYFNLEQDGNVNVTLARRSPGSAIKPLTYALALERKIITPATVISDTPIVYQLPGQAKPYSPTNYDNRWHGLVTARTALGSSYNVPAVKILNVLGVGSLVDAGRETGIRSWQDSKNYGLSLTLGGGDLTLVEMTQLYSIFANSGQMVPLSPILKVTDAQGKTLEDNNEEQSRVFSAETAFLISDILTDNGARTPAFGPNSNLIIPGRTVAVKTGTTQEKRDNLTIGYTPSLVVAVWVGNNDNSPMSPYLESGNTGAAAIWNPIMTALLKDEPNEPFSKPDGVVALPICTINSLLSCENCPSVRSEYFLRGTEPTRACNFSREDSDRIRREREEQEKQNRPRP